jgi:hypothetical protein
MGWKSNKSGGESDVQTKSEGTHRASNPMDTGTHSGGMESAHIYNDQDTAIISLKATLFAKAFFLTGSTHTTADAHRVA